jgi:hypothetical protein
VLVCGLDLFGSGVYREAVKQGPETGAAFRLSPRGGLVTRGGKGKTPCRDALFRGLSGKVTIYDDL